MNKSFKKILAMGLALTLVLGAGQFDYAHSGRTDSSGGHKDNKNKSGLGYYHYHHGYGPHLHSGGVCPYEVTSVTESSTLDDNDGLENLTKHDHGNLPDFTVKVCGSKIDQSGVSYPFFVYNNVTYIPMTWDLCQAIGIVSEYTEGEGLRLTTDHEKSGTYAPEKSENPIKTDEIDIADVDINVWIDDILLMEDSQYPLKQYKGVTYIPLTWDIAKKLGVEYEYSNELGLIIN